MRVPSISSNSIRVAPQQERSARRLAAFLEAAEALFAEHGFEAATMQAIADRSASSIGALYNYFPDKQAIAVTLLRKYSEELRSRIRALMDRAETLSTRDFAVEFIDCIIQFARDYPAWLNLLTAPVRFRRDAAARRALRLYLAQAFERKNPALSSERAMLVANVSVQIAKGMMAVYTDSEPKMREAVIAEFRSVLAAYLEQVLAERS
ncbi:TetR/AcrR family transcriptional regulator [Acidobacterium capsulatum]|uniref:Transcriptional regulatory protein n=1 Tax=Acidobacterium capsulatum (strain ATCC 51196 / DSM 11244 / BCRC 80197 / JCM 7670 / NBRC 15755 / NCIMB 13165 / 161) TaxID=240015 RepID=C1F5Z3_ACIC5|nr:transcriptional regulatory protein [Acidobacterium capsulatum ATCC 51196]